jgi:CRP/FNR family cyclic AMP-dependent transcriptional regulator
MSYMTRKLLADVDLLSSLPEDVLDDLVHRGATLTTPPGGSLVEQGSDSAGLQIILEGAAEIEVYGKRRRAIGPGDFFGEISMIDGSPRSATVIAGPEGVTTFALSSLAFAPVIAENPAVAKSLLVSLCARLRAADALQSGQPGSE